VTALTFTETINLHFDPLDDLDPKIHSIPKAFCIVSSLPLFELHKYSPGSTYRHFLMKLYNIYKQKGMIEAKPGRQQLSIEFMLSLLFSHIYFSSKVNSEVQLVHSGNDFEWESLLRYRNYKDYGFVLQNFSFELLVKRISPLNILRIVCALLLERKVILLFHNYQQNAVIMESIISLLCPL
jgi:hypothetical protein